MPQSEKNDMPTLKNLLSPARSMPQWNESRRGKLKPHDAEPVGLSKTNNPGPVVHPYLVAPWKRNRAQSEHLKKSTRLKENVEVVDAACRNAQKIVKINTY